MDESDHRRVDVAELGQRRVDAGGAACEHLDDVTPGDESRHVEIVDRRVEEQAARVLQVCARWRVRVAARDPDEVKVADVARRDCIPDRLVPRVEAAVEPDLKQHSRLVDRGARAGDRPERERERLLAEDRLACGGSGEDQLHVGGGAGADRHCVHVARPDQLLRGGRHRRPERAPHRLCGSGIRVEHGRERQSRHAALEQLGMHPADPAGADDADPDRGRHHSIRAVVRRAPRPGP